jgi:hypothetical protein
MATNLDPPKDVLVLLHFNIYFAALHACSIGKNDRYFFYTSPSVLTSRINYCTGWVAQVCLSACALNGTARTASDT